MTTATPEEVKTTTIQVDEAALAEIQTFAPTLEQDANDLVINTEADYTESLAIVETAIDREEKIMAFFNEPTSLAFKLHRSLTSRVKFLVGPYQRIQSTVKAKRQDYRDRKAAEDRKREEAQNAANRKAVEDAAVKRAQDLAARGEHEAADAVIERAATMPVPATVVTPSVQKQEGTALKKVWDFRIDDPSLIPEKYKVIDETAIRKVVQALGDKHEIPGVTAFQKEQEAFRRK